MQLQYAARASNTSIARSLPCFVAVVAGQGDDVTENIGFGQVADSVLEGETKMARVRLGPEATDVNVFGRIVPLSLSQYMNYNFITSRTVPQSVEDTITMNTTDPAECKNTT